MPKDFCHLHVHTEYSVLDGINKIDDLCKHVKRIGMSSCAISDHGVLHGVVDFYQKGQEAKINPIIGVEAYVTYDPDDAPEDYKKTRDNHHLLLLAMNNKGLENLYWLTNQGNLHNFYYKPRMTIANLESHSEGIIATTSCLGGVISKQFQWEDEQKVKHYAIDEDKGIKAIERFASIFNNRLYLEIQDNDESQEQLMYNEWLLEKAKQMKLPTVITADAHFLTRNDKEVHDIMMARQVGVTLKDYDKDPEGLKYSAGNYIRSPDEMYEAAIKCGSEEAFWNTTEIAKQCSISIELGKYQTPLFDPSREKDYTEFKRWRNECLGH